MKQKRLLAFSTLFLLFFWATTLRATHNRAGEIHIEQIGGCNSLTIKATIITWTRTSSTNADRDTLEITWGDGKRQSVPRSNGISNQGVPLPNDIKYNEYVAIHTYAGPATYVISMTDPNRIAGIINVNPPSSDNVQFHIETTYAFQDPQFGGCNTTPYLLQPPVDVACIGKPFRHNPNAFDPDGDSLSYHLIVPLQDVGSAVPLYSYPSNVNPGPNNVLQLDQVSGDLLWYSPQKEGEYNLALIIVSWRGGVAIDTTIRDMQISVSKCENNPPEVQTIDELCVVAGDTITFTATGNDLDSANFVQLTALGGPFSTPYSPATFTAPTGFVLPVVTGTFRWITTCEHISDQAYSVVFKAVDSLDNLVPQLADLETVQIKVVGPPPLDVQADAQQGYSEITWQKPYACEDAAENYFYGFSVWRREGSNPFPLDTCAPGLAGKGYTELVFKTEQIQNGRYYFKDTTIERGRTYCYRVLGKFARISSGGYPYNLVESLPSEEVCIQLPRDLPLITNVSVQQTDTNSGEIEVRWSRPVVADLDTLLNHGPYRYQVRRVQGFGPGGLLDVPGGSLVSTYFATGPDTFFVDKQLNTQDHPYAYEIAYFIKGSNVPFGKTNVASSVFLNIASTDNANVLTWREEVPWNNYRYVIYRENPLVPGQFDSIGTSLTQRYTDNGLANGQQYCYYVKSIGTYSIGGLVNPIFNLSQIGCGVPLDTLPPCAPQLTVSNLCTTGQPTLPDPPFENALTWTSPATVCGSDDVVQYNIFFAPTSNDPLVQIETINGANSLTFTHLLDGGVAGCYAVSAVDLLGNESAKSQEVCTDNCPSYELPNAFTPDGDGSNELFTPFPGWRFIESVDMQIFNQWGNLVFQTADPAINWTGKTTEGKAVSDGTYFYICRLYERRVEGLVLRPDILKGYIEVIRGR